MSEQWVIVRRHPGEQQKVETTGYEPEQIRAAVKACVDRHGDEGVDVWAARASTAWAEESAGPS